MTVAAHDSPILVTGAAGDVGGKVTEILLGQGRKVRALVRSDDDRAEALRQMGAEVMQGDLTDLDAMHRAIEGIKRLYFGMSVSATYLEASVNVAAVARDLRVEAFVNMSQMSVSSMSITQSSLSPQHRLHWLAEQALEWSGLPLVTVRPTIFMEGFFLRMAASVQASDELALPFGQGKTSPISTVDVARGVAAILDDPARHIGRIYNLTGPELGDLEHFAGAFSDALGRTIHYRDVPVAAWAETLRRYGLPEHLVRHLAVLADWHVQGRFDRMTDDQFKLTGEKPMSMADFVKRHAAEFTRGIASA